MKTALAIWFSVALVMSQGIAVLNVAAPVTCAPQKKCCCGKDQPCCTAHSQSAFPVVPALPAPSGAGHQLQLALPATHLVFDSSDFSSAQLSRLVPSVPIVGAVSLYQRNCVYLI